MRRCSPAFVLALSLFPLTAKAQLLGLLDRSPPTVAIEAPASGAFVSGDATLVVQASDGLGSGVASVDWQLGSTTGQWTPLSFDLMGFRWRGSWDSHAAADGSAVIYVRARDRAGNERIAWRALLVSNPPSAPMGLVVAPPPPPSDGGQLDLTWSPNPEPDVVAYHVYASNAEAGPWARVATVATANWRDGGAPVGNARYYRVSAQDAAGNESPRSAVASGTPVDTRAPAITDVQVRNIDADTVRISWRTHEPATSEVRYGTTEELEEVARQLAFVVDHAVELDALAPDTVYGFVVRSMDASANAGGTQPATFTTRINPPPSVSIRSPADGAVLAGPAKLVATASDDVAVAHVEWTVGGIEWQAMPFNALTGQWEVDLAQLPDGAVQLGVRAYDDQGATAIDSIAVLLERAAPVVEIVEPIDEAHMDGGIAHPIRADVHDATLASVEWQIVFVPPDLDLEAPPPTDPAGWVDLPHDPSTGFHEVQWPAPEVVIENEGFLFVRATDSMGRVTRVEREITVIPLGPEFSFIGTGGETITGGAAVGAVGPGGGQRIGIEFRCRGCVPGGDYEVAVVGANGERHAAALRADERGRGDAFLEEATTIVDLSAATITPAGPGF